MSQDDAAILQALLTKAGLQWAVEWFGRQDRTLGFLREKLAAARAEAASRFGPAFSGFGPVRLAALHEKDPQKIEAFLQVLCSSVSPGMLVMVWRVLSGWHVAEMGLSYVEEQSFHLRVVVKPSRDAEQTEAYESADIHDASLLRHLGILTMDGKPVFDGFFPLKTGDS